MGLMTIAKQLRWENGGHSFTTTYIFKIKKKEHGMENFNLDNISERQSARGLHVPVFDLGKHLP